MFGEHVQTVTRQSTAVDILCVRQRHCYSACDRKTRIIKSLIAYSMLVVMALSGVVLFWLWLAGSGVVLFAEMQLFWTPACMFPLVLLMRKPMFFR